MKIDKPQHRWQLSFEGDWPTAVAFLGDKRVAAGNRAGQIFVWDLDDLPSDDSPPVEESAKQPRDKDRPPGGPPRLRLEGHANGVTHLRAVGDTLVSSSLDHSVCLWDTQASPTGSDTVVLDAKQREQQARRASKDDREAIINAPGASVDVLQPVRRLEGHGGWVFAMDLNADGSRIVSGDDQCVSIVWDAKSGRQLSSWRGYDRVWVRSAAIAPAGDLVFTCEFAGRRSNFDAPAAQARLWNAADGSLQTDLLKIWTPDVKDEDRQDTYGYWRTWGKLLKRGLVCAQFSPDGALLAVGQGGETDTGKVHLVDVDSGKILRTVSGHRYGVCDVKFSADGACLLSGGRDTTVRICQVSDGKEVAALGTQRGGQFKDWMHAVAVSPNQRLVAAADIAGSVHVWQLA